MPFTVILYSKKESIDDKKCNGQERIGFVAKMRAKHEKERKQYGITEA